MRLRSQARCDHASSTSVDAIATGDVPASVVAPKIREKETEVARIEARLRQPLPEAPDLDRLRAALGQRTAQWRADLRAEPKVAGSWSGG